MSDRPYATYGLADLQLLFERSREDSELLQAIAYELEFRTRKKASHLRDRVLDAIDTLDCVKVSVGGRQNNENGSESHIAVLMKNDPVVACQPSVEFLEFNREQLVIVECDEDAAMLIEAGPGTGKTAVACSRVGHLIEKIGLSASKILLVSFTRTAVRELRDRIEIFASDPKAVAGVKIVTLDSFTWQVVRGLGDKGEEELFKSYEENIEGFVQMLNDGDPDLLDHLSELEHVVIDESQDMVGPRADLCLALIEALSPECGVTIFADSAQAIYGFTDDLAGSTHERGTTLVHRVRLKETRPFEETELDRVHRTADKKLVRLFSEGRKRLLGVSESSFDSWKEMKKLISECAHGTVGYAKDQNLDGKSDHLVLFRSRAEVLLASSYLWGDGIAHKLRMSRIQTRVHPWLARMFWDFEDDYIDLNGFRARWTERISPGVDENVFAVLRRIAGDGVDRVSVRRLRSIAGRDRPPIEFLVDETELAGPVLGTIHASKGREANTVHLMLPPDTFMEGTGKNEKSGAEIAEEERVLFVGATRARETLRVGKGDRLFASRLESGRVFKGVRNNSKARQVEIGLLIDLDRASLASSSRPLDEVKENQEWFWAHRFDCVELYTEYDFHLRRIVLFRKEDDRELGFMSDLFAKDLFEIADRVKDANRPGKTTRHIRMIGSSTVVIPESMRTSLHSPWRHSGIVLAPVLTGFPMVYFNS